MKNERERIIGSRINGPGSYTLKALSRTRGGGRKKKREEWWGALEPNR